MKKVEKTNGFGNSFKIDVKLEADNDSEKQFVLDIVKEALAKICEKTKLADLRNFLAKLYILQYMMSMERVLHEKLDNQEWGQKGICIWTKDQKDIIDEIMSDLKEGKVVKRVISGGPGSGKTLMLQEIVKQALEVKVQRLRRRQRNVFIGIPSCNTRLKAMLEGKFKGKDGCRIGNEFSKRAYGKDGWADLIIWDEKGLEIGEEIKAFENGLFSSRWYIIHYNSHLNIT